MSDNSPRSGPETNKLRKRVGRYVRVGTNVGSVAVRIAGAQLLGLDNNRDRRAAALARALGGLKGPIMKVAQLLSTIPDALPEEYAAELSQLQSHAPAMGWPFVKRRMRSELGPDWRAKFSDFEQQAVAAASLGQVHRATSLSGQALACKLQYPDMESAVEADLAQLKIAFSIHRRMDPAVDTSQILAEIAARLREELDYRLEAHHTKLYANIFSASDLVHVPETMPDLSTRRLLTMSWLDGAPLIAFKAHPQVVRNQIARAMFHGWWHPFSRFGVIHGDPHLGNYTIRQESDDQVTGINLLDYGCMRTFQPQFVQGVINLYRGLLHDDRDLMVNAYEIWGFTGLSAELIDILNIWAKFIYGPLLDDRERRIAEGVSPGSYGRKEAMTVHNALKEKGPVKVPRAFVFMDRAAIGLGGVFLHLDAHLNFYKLFNETIEGFDIEQLRSRQRNAFAAANVPEPASE